MSKLESKFVKYEFEYALSKIRELEKDGNYNRLVLSFVKRSLKRERVGNEWFSSELQYLLYRRYFRGYVSDVILSPSYAVVRTVEFQIRRRRYWGGYVIIEVRRTWIVGVNSDSKLFINLVAYESRSRSVEEVSEVRVVASVGFDSDDGIREYYMAYTSDRADNEIVEIDEEPKPISLVRVQGEVVTQVECNEEECVKRRLVSDILMSSMDRVYQLAHTYYANVIRRILTDLGFSAIEVRLDGWHTRITIPSVVPSDKQYDDEVKSKIIRLEDLIKERIGEKRVYVSIDRGSSGFGGYKSVVVEVDLQDTLVARRVADYLRHEAEKLVERLVSERAKRKYTVYFGNHKVVIESLPLEYTFILPDDVNPLKNIYPENRVSISVSLRNNRRFYVLSGYEAYLYHSEHGVARVVFKRPYVVDLATTHVDPLHNVYANRVAFSRL